MHSSKKELLVRLENRTAKAFGFAREEFLVGSVQEIDAADVLAELPNRIHEVIDRYVKETPDWPALIEDGNALSYRELDRTLKETAEALGALGIRGGDRIMIVSENCIALACLLLAASRLDAWAIVANPRLSPRELDQIRDHSGARRSFFTTGVSKEAAVHASRYDANAQNVGPLRDIGVSALNTDTMPEPVEADPAKQIAVLIYTSGTTGTPKGVMLTHENLLFSAKTTAWFRRMDANDKVYLVCRLLLEKKKQTIRQETA